MNALELQEEVSALGSDEKEFLRESAKTDLYVLAKGVLGYPDVNPRTHGAYCRFYDRSGKRRRLGLMPRGHLKSTLATVTDSVRIVLKDPENARILIANETADLARKFLSEIKGHWEKNQLLRQLFPELVPTRFTGPGVQWSQDKATLNRQNVLKEPHWQALGVGGAAVGSHFTHIKNDDLIGFEAARSQARMEYTIAWNDNIESLLVDHHVDVIDWIGTRWKLNDLYSHVMETYGDRLAVFTRGAIENGEIIFPEKHTWEEYNDLQQNRPFVWASQYENNPLSGVHRDLPIENVGTFQFSLDGQEVILDPGQRTQKVFAISQLDIVITVDPNSGTATAEDEAAIEVTGVTPDDDILVLQDWAGRVSSSEFVDKIFELAKRWRPRVVGIEKAGQQSTQHYFEKKLVESDHHVRVEPLKHGNRDKFQRIRDSLEPIVTSGRLYLLPNQTELRKQISEFPNTILIDRLDALAYGTQVWRKPYRVADVKKSKDALKMILFRRNLRTGY